MMITSAGASALIGLLAIGLAPNVWILSIGAFLAGSSTGLVSPPFGLAISLWIRAKQQGKANTWINSGTSLGIIFTGLSASLLPFGWRETYIIYAILTLMIIVWNYIIIPKYNKNLNIYTGSLNFRDIKGSEFVSIASVMLGIATAPFWTFSKAFVESLGNYSSIELSLFWVAIGLFGILGGLSGMVVERRGLSFAFKLCVILLSAASIVLAFAPSIWILPFVSAALFGISYIAITGILLVWGITIFIKNASLGIGLPFLLLAAGQILGSLLGGVIIEYIGYSFTFLAFGLFGVFSLICSPQRDPVIREPRDYDFKSDG